MIRLRESLDDALRHPLLGPLLLLFLALTLAFVSLHAIEHGVEGLLFSCVLLVATGLPLVVVLGRTWRTTVEAVRLSNRAPPRQVRRRLATSGSPPAAAGLPLRR